MQAIFHSHRNWFFGLGVLLVISIVGCAGKQGPATVGEAEPGINELNAIRVEPVGEGAALVLEGTGPMAPNIFKLADPDRIIIDLTDTKLGSVERDMAVNQGEIGQITVNQFDDAQSSLSRIVVSLNSPAEYQVESQGNGLRLNVGKAVGEVGLDEGDTDEVDDGGFEGVAEAGLVDESEADVMAEPIEEPGLDDPALEDEVSEEPLAEVEPFDSEEPLDVAEPVSPMDVGPTGTSENASQLVDMQYSSSETGTVITLKGDAPIEQYEDFVLDNPQRVVIDLKGLEKTYAGPETITLGTNEVNQLRLGTSAEHVRVVLDSKSETTPAYTITRDGNNLVVSVASIPGVEAEDMVADVGGEMEPVEDMVPVEPMLDEPVAASSGQPVLIQGLAFKQARTDQKSRLIISMNQPTSDYTVNEGTGQVTISVRNARLEKPILRREFDTREFETAILSVAPKEDRGGRTVDFVVELEQQVPYTVAAEGNNLVLNVDIPAQLLRQRTPTLAGAGGEAAVPPPPSAQGVDERIMTDDLQEPSSAPMEEVTFSSAVQPVGKVKDGRPQDYRYVKEEFMSESMIGTGALSRMGAILSGELEGKTFAGRKISLDFKDADIRSIFRLIADISKLNMIISDDVQGRVTIRLDDVPWDQAFAIILQTKGLWFERYGSIVRIAPADKLRQEKELAAAAARAARAAKPLDILFKPVSFAAAGTLIKQISSVLSDRGSVDIDSRTNTLIIKDIRENLEKARRMVDILDTQTPQVSIEARIVEATTTFTRSFGIQWGGNYRMTAATGNPTGLFFPNSVAVSPFALNFPVEAGFINSTANIKLGSVNNIVDLDLSLALGEQQGHSKLISAPKVTVLDNSSATISAGSKIPFLTQTANAGSNVRFEQATTSLSVSPHITNDGSILMQITANRNEPNFAQLVQGNPLIDQRSATTEVLVKSGNTTVLGGIYSTQQAKSESRFPFLSKIPLLGALFKNYDNQRRRTELLIFVTPRIVGDEREAVRDVRQ